MLSDLNLIKLFMIKMIFSIISQSTYASRLMALAKFYNVSNIDDHNWYIENYHPEVYGLNIMPNDIKEIFLDEWYEYSTITTVKKNRSKRQIEHHFQGVECGPNGDNTKLVYVRTDKIDNYNKIMVERITWDASQKVSAIKICCPGYSIKEYNGKKHCRPRCVNCGKGECVAPETCECYNNYVPNDEGVCIETCPLSCGHGRCNLANECKCYCGYHLDETKEYCNPICDEDCGKDPRHKCLTPGVCGCVHGFKMTDDGFCKPDCNPPCGSGGECQAIGMSAKCACYPGYKLRNGVCETDCYQTCANGICYNRHTCHCFADFIYDETTRNCVARYGYIARDILF
ncbi:uncharacterized protein LOC142224169 [Haematobia irritans]|uniref:uncharacterized protein LOC142224169 n=1 Tax=Haematobia irritans TaxID=7368 RepID=UPI003F4F546D